MAIVRRLGVLVFRFRDYLATAVLLGLIATAPYQAFTTSHTLDRLLDSVGCLLLLLGLIVRLLVVGSVDIRRGGIHKRLAASRLLRSGLYSHTRNPLYLANFLILTGLALIYDSRWVYLVGLPALLLSFCAIVAAEEEFLARRFGDDYAAYRARVNRFWPTTHGLRGTLQAVELDWRRALRREHGTIFAACSAALALHAAEAMARRGLHAAGGTLEGVAAAWGILVLLYVTVRWLKKTRRLESYVSPAPTYERAFAIPAKNLT